jgi:molybdate transport repressor ModE-like protein
MRSPTFRQLRTFLAVAKTGSVSVAARSLGLTQPAASQQLRELERTLSVRLFERANGKSILTTAGRSLLEPARRAQAAAEDAIAVTAESRLGDTGQLRVGAGATGCIYLLPSVLGAVKQAIPGLTVTVMIGDTADLLPRLESGELDLGLMTLPTTTSPALSSTHLFSEPLVAVLPASARASEKAMTATQLIETPLISYQAAGHTRFITDAWFRSAGVVPQPIMELGSFEAIKKFVGADSEPRSCRDSLLRRRYPARSPATCAPPSPALSVT